MFGVTETIVLALQSAFPMASSASLVVSAPPPASFAASNEVEAVTVTGYQASLAKALAVK